MGLETGVTYISDLNPLNPAEGDQAKDGDNHIRITKGAIKTTFPNVTGAVTASHTELNLIDGLTASAAELNKLDGATMTTAQLNFLVGVTSAIQTQLNTLAASIAASAAVAPGTISIWGGAAAPSGYILCQGAAISRADNPIMFAAYGTAWGVGDGSTTFNVPDMRGVVPRGLDAGKGYDTGRVLGTYQADGLLTHGHTATTASAGSHTHTVTDPGHGHDLTTNNIDWVSATSHAMRANTSASSVDTDAIVNATTGITLVANGAHTHTITVVDYTGTAENRVKNNAVNFIVKLG